MTKDPKALLNAVFQELRWEMKLVFVVLITDPLDGVQVHSVWLDKKKAEEMADKYNGKIRTAWFHGKPDKDTE